MKYSLIAYESRAAYLRRSSETMTVCFKKRKKTKAVWSVTYYHNFSVNHMAVPLLSPENFDK